MAHGTSLPSHGDLLKLRYRNSEMKGAAYDTGAACIGRWRGRGQVFLTKVAPTPGLKIRGEGRPLIGEKQRERDLTAAELGMASAG